MNAYDILDVLGDVGDADIWDAQTVRTGSALPGRKAKRIWLIAAAAALALLLLGCAVAYAIHVWDLKLGEESHQASGSDGNPYYRQILTLDGLKGTPGYQAAVEWYEFCKEYNGEHWEEDLQRLEAGTVSVFPTQYSGYNLRSQQMKDKLDEILTKYGLQPQGGQLGFRTVKNLCSALGIEKIQTLRNDIALRVTDGACWENGNIFLSLDLTLPGGGALSHTEGWLYWNRKDCFSGDRIFLDDREEWKEWNYTASSGTTVLIARPSAGAFGWIFCDREEALLSVKVQIREDRLNESGREYVYLSDRQIEEIADIIDFGIQPKKTTWEDAKNQPAPPASAFQNGYAVELKHVDTDGVVAYFTLGITVPETQIEKGMSLDRIEPGNGEILSPAAGEMDTRSYSWIPQEDNDGLYNTQDLLLEVQMEMTDGSVPFRSGSEWKIHIEDLCFAHWDEAAGETVKTVLTEGEWNFDISFGEDCGNFREYELVSEPVKTTVRTGWDENGEDVYGEALLTSFKLRTYSSSYTLSGDAAKGSFLFESGGPRVVMKDGSRIFLPGNGPAGGRIDLSQADYVLLPDGTVLEIPE